MPRLLATVALFAFVLYCLLDVLLSDRRQVRHLPKSIWLAVVLLAPLVGGGVWLYAGRPSRTAPTPGGAGPRPPTTTAGPPGRPPTVDGPTRRPRGPDDDPDFLRDIDERLRRRNDGTT